MTRISQTFTNLGNQSAFIAYICAGDPNFETSLEVLNNLPAQGVDIIELGVPFLNPAGDGPTIENASKRAIKNGASLKNTLKMVEEFRKNNTTTPIVLMSYFNPIFKFGYEDFFKAASDAGVDGVLIVDLTIEENGEVLQFAKNNNVDLIQLIAPTTDAQRIAEISNKASGFLYLISMLGITGTKSADIAQNKINLEKIRQNSNLPVAIGFGIKEPKQAKEFAQIGVDGIVIGSAFVKDIADNFVANRSKNEICDSVLRKVSEFAQEINS